MAEDASRAAWLYQARSYLRNADPVLARLIDDRPAFDRAWMAQLPAMDLYGALLFQVTGQQLSVQATRRILARIEILFDGHLPSPDQLLGIDPVRLREAGLSWRKINASVTSPSDCRMAGEPDHLEQLARRRSHSRAHRNSWDRSLDRAGRAHHCAPARRRRPAGRSCAP